MRVPIRRRTQHGSAMTALLVAVGLCAALSASVVTTNTARQREANVDFHRERAFQLAEAGLDWGLSQIRIRYGVVPSVLTSVREFPGVGKFTLRYAQGNANGRDDDGDTVVDNSGESGYATLLSTGESGGVRRTLEVLVRKAVDVPDFGSSLQINVETPILDLSGNAFRISGDDHNLDGSLDPTGTSMYGIATPAAVADVTAQIPAGREDDITGSGGEPSVGQVAPMDLNTIMAQAQAAANVSIQPGTHTTLDLGTPTLEGAKVAYCNGDLHISGSGSGAGVLAVDGDLQISGGFTWVGIILVRGRLVLTGGGSEIRVIGALGVGEEITNSTGSTEVGLGGTVDLLYSGEAVGLAAETLSIMAVMSWWEAANP